MIPELIIHHGNVVISWIPAMWSRMFVLCKEFFHILARALVHEFTLGKQNDVVNELPDEGGRLMNGQDDTSSRCTAGIALEELHQLQSRFGVCVETMEVIIASARTSERK
eukprot:scaffold12743_cov56-Cylindrotheca_fusiformis.AAC.1